MAPTGWALNIERAGLTEGSAMQQGRAWEGSWQGRQREAGILQKHKHTFASGADRGGPRCSEKKGAETRD